MVGSGLHAQGSDALYARVNLLSGWEVRGFTFDPGIGMKSVTQWNVPVVVVAPLGRRMSLDVSTYYVSGTVETYDGGTQTLSGMTDTQLRLLYTLSRDRLVGSVPSTFLLASTQLRRASSRLPAPWAAATCRFPFRIPAPHSV